MAKRGRRRGGVNKSELIRNKKNELGPRARPRDIIAALAEKGIHVSRALVTNVLTRAERTDGSKPVAAKPPRAAEAPLPAPRGRKSSGESVPMGGLLGAKKLVAEVGSVAEARRALDAYEKLM